MRMRLSFVAMAAMVSSFAGSMQMPARADDGSAYSSYMAMQSQEALVNESINQRRWADYYAEHVRVRLGPEQRLPNGVSWRLLIDQRTGIAMPRITWMPDRKSMAVANRMLEALQGQAVEAARAEAKNNLEFSQEILKEKPYLTLSLLIHRPFTIDRSVMQTDIALTYATANYVSLVELSDSLAPEANFNPRHMQGLILDLRRDRVLATGACPGKEEYRGLILGDGFFQFGDLLQICDETSRDAFLKFIYEKAKPALAAAVNSKDSFIKRCRKPYLCLEAHQRNRRADMA